VSEWSFSALVGRLTELTGAALTPAFSVVLEAQRLGEPVAFVGNASSGFFPPDAAESGIDLDALVVVRAQNGDAAAIARAADQLARSGAFGLLVIDLAAATTAVPAPLLTRLLGLAQKHGAAMLFLTAARTPPLGSLISLRVECRRKRGAVELLVVKDKRRAPGWTARQECRGPAGLR
jgi:recombination protein RecA